MSSNSQKSECISCRHHSKSKRRKALGIADGEMELLEWAEEDDPLVVLVCKHPEQADKEMGSEESAPGADCQLYEPGGKKKLSPETERLLKRWS